MNEKIDNRKKNGGHKPKLPPSEKRVTISPRVSKETSDYLKSNDTGISQGKLIDKSIALYRLTFEQSKSHDN